jgi:hypothetical protein
MKIVSLKYFSVIILAPYFIGMSPADSSYTEYTLGAGSGQYASYDCSGRSYTNSLLDVGFKVSHKYKSHFRAGASLSVYSMNGAIHCIGYPDLAFDAKYFSFGTTGIRLGSEDIIYGELSFLDQVPYFTGKGCARIGVGMNVYENTHLWIGRSAIPYDRPAWAGQIEFPISSGQFLFFNGRYGLSTNIPEYGLSVGTKWRLH